MPQYLLPDVGEGLTEAEIVSWKVKVGDTIAINDIVCEIETAKSIVELPSPYAGVVSAILAPEGETIPSARRSSRSATTPRSPPRRRSGRAARWRSTCPTRPRPGPARARAWSAG